MTVPTLRTLPPAWRLLLASFLLVMLFGFTHALVFVELTTRMSTSGIAERYVGTEAVRGAIDTLPADAEIQYEKSTGEMLNIIHTHVLALGMMFLLAGAVFLLAEGIPPWLRKTLTVEPFLSLLLTFGGMWLTRFVSPSWSLLVAVSGVAMTAAFVAMVLISLYQLSGMGTRRSARS